jgi:metallophosphoesterase superfamily enzyme
MSVQDFLSKIIPSPHPVILNGDICDLANCKKSEVEDVKRFANSLRNRCTYIQGNHSLNAIADGFDFFYATPCILFSHGHRVSWSKTMCDKFMSQEEGAGWFKRQILVRTVDALRRLLAVRPSKHAKAFIEAEKAKNPALTTLIMGHSHPLNHVYFTHVGVHCVILKRGVWDITIRDDGSIGHIEAV